MCAFGTWIPKKEPFENRWFTRFFPWVCTSPISQPSATRGLQIAKDDVAAIRWLFSSGSFRDQGHKPLFVGCKGSVGCLKQLEAWKKQQIFWRQRLLSSPLSPPPTVYHSFWTTNYCRWNFSHWHLIWPDLQETFKKFDEDGSGDIDVCELSDMLRFQGHAAGIDEATTELGGKQGQWRNNLFQGKQK